MIRKYCRAYYMRDFRQWSRWTEMREEGMSELKDEDVVYLWDDFVVVRSPVLPGGVIFDQVTKPWQDFCQTTLAFEVPSDCLRYAYKPLEETQNRKEEPAQEQSQAAH